MNALTQVGIKDVGVCSFGETVNILHPFGKPFSDQCGDEILKKLTFNENIELISKMIETSISMFTEHRSHGTSISSVPSKLLLMVSDGMVVDRVEHHKAIERATDRDIFLATMIIDHDSTWRKVQEKHFNGLFPFPYSLKIKNADQLPQEMADSLRQWFEFAS